jgi:phosphoribosyl-ATP pyrophosphohydrolase/phosphoribosyl-AMP cyclohydrolase
MIIPSIDLMNGKAVQLIQGKEKKLERADVIDLAKQFNKYSEIAVIDLDAAFGNHNNLELIKSILKIADCRVGGGLRTLKQIKELISYGANKVIIGSIAFENDRINHEFLKSLSSEVGTEYIIIALDVINNEIVSKGWRHKTGLDIFSSLSELEPYCSEFLITSIDKEGLMQGINIDLFEKIAKRTKKKITAAGGISSVEDVQFLSNLGFNCQIGMAIYTGKMSLQDCFIASLNWAKELIPTIAQDEDGDVLMLAYSNKESIKKTFETNKMWYFSRSRNKLWMKGETSGNEQEFIKYRIDCDGDALLATVRQKNYACHTGNYSCFGSRHFTLNQLYEVVHSRLQNPSKTSYTSSLTEELLKDKLIEEIQELIEAKTADEIIWEAADVLYFVTVLLARNNITFQQVIQELYRRRKK